MKFLFNIRKHLTIKNLILGLIIILITTLLKFIGIGKLILALFNLIDPSEAVQYIVSSFIALILRLGIKGIVEELVDQLMPYLFMDANPHDHNNDSGNEKPLNKGKATSTDSDTEKPLSKGKATSTDSDTEKPLNKGKGKATSTDTEADHTKTLVSTTGNALLDQHTALSNRIRILMLIKNSRMLTDQEHSELLSLLEIARSDTEISKRSTSYSVSSNSSSAVSLSPSTGAQDKFPTYNPADYESESEAVNKGESSNKKK
jgi:hypothetical protein